MTNLNETAQALRRAVAAGRFEEVPALTVRYVALIEEQAPTDALQREATALLAWARETAIARRAHAAARLKELITARQYEPAAPATHITEALG